MSAYFFESRLAQQPLFIFEWEEEGQATTKYVLNILSVHSALSIPLQQLFSLPPSPLPNSYSGLTAGTLCFTITLPSDYFFTPTCLSSIPLPASLVENAAELFTSYYETFCRASVYSWWDLIMDSRWAVNTQNPYATFGAYVC